MTRRSEASGTSIQHALIDAVSGLLDCEPEKVELEVAAPGLDELSGPVRVQLEVDEVSSRADVEPTLPPEQAEEPHADPTMDQPAADDVREASSAEDASAEDASAEDASSDEASSDEASSDAGVVDDAVAGGDRVAADPDEGNGEAGEALTPEDLDAEADAAADFLEGLLDAMDLPGDLRLRVHDDHAEVEIVEIGSGALIGRRGQTLEAIQELLRCALQREFQRRARVKVDAEGYRARRLEKLLEKAEEAIDHVLDTGDAQRLEPMDVFERKAVHHLVAEVEGLASRSQGREPARRVVIERE